MVDLPPASLKTDSSPTEFTRSQSTSSSQRDLSDIDDLLRSIDPGETRDSLSTAVITKLYSDSSSRKFSQLPRNLAGANKLLAMLDGDHAPTIGGRHVVDNEIDQLERVRQKRTLNYDPPVSSLEPKPVPIKSNDESVPKPSSKLESEKAAPTRRTIVFIPVPKIKEMPKEKELNKPKAAEENLEQKRAEFKKQVLESGRFHFTNDVLAKEKADELKLPMVISITGSHCPACRPMDNIVLHPLEKEKAGQAVFLTVNAEHRGFESVGKRLHLPLAGVTPQVLLRNTAGRIVINQKGIDAASAATFKKQLRQAIGRN